MNRFQFKEWLDREAFDIVQPDCSRTGITEAWHMARMAHLRRKYCVPHNWNSGLTIVANGSLVAALPNRLMLEWNHTYSPLKEAILKEPLVNKRGYIDLPDDPGSAWSLFRIWPRDFHTSRAAPTSPIRIWPTRNSDL